MTTPIRLQSTTDTYVQNEDTLFANGNDGSTAPKATSSVTIAKKTLWDGTAFQLGRQAVAGVITALTGIDSTLPLAQYLATLPTLTNNDWRSLLLTKRGELVVSFTDYSLTNKGGTTSSTANTITQVMTANVSRKIAKIQNPYSNSVILQVLIGASGSEFVDIELSPGDLYTVSSSDRVSIRCTTTASVTFYASEG